MVECAGLENRWAARSRGFESPSLLQKSGLFMAGNLRTSRPEFRFWERGRG